MASVLAKAKQLLTPAASWYGQQLTQRPIVTKSITSCVLFMVGDGMAQSIEGKGMDVARLARMGIWGGMFGVMAHGWFGMLEKLVTSTGNWGAFYRVLWDQVSVIVLRCLRRPAQAASRRTRQFHHHATHTHCSSLGLQW